MADNSKINSAREFLDGISDREKKFLKKQLGIDSDNDLSLEDIDKRPDIIRARIRELETRALRKLKDRNDS